MHLADLATPQIVVDHGRLLENIDRGQRLAAAAGLALRPHAKTHKSPAIARWQIERGAAGVCLAKIGEAEVFAAAGVRNIRIAYPVQPFNAARIVALMDRAAISIVVDDLNVAQGWSDVMRRANRRLDVLVKVDVGFHRCGIDPQTPAAFDFIATVAALPGLRLAGLLSHAGHAYDVDSDEALQTIAAREAVLLNDLATRARRRGLPIEEVSVGATPTLRFSVRQEGLTELRPGTYVYFDRTQVALGAASLDHCALTVLATVVSRPAPDRIILDCGSKTLSTDRARGLGDAAGFGAVLSEDGSSIDSRLTIGRLSEEHAIVAAAGETRLKPGDRVRVLPNHACVVSNLVDAVQLVEGDRILETLPVAARGRIT